MSFATASKKAEDVKQSSSNYINKSGIYPVRIIAPIVNVSNEGSTTVEMYVDYNGQKQDIYGNLRVTNKNGERNEIGSKIFNQLLIINGIDEVADPVEEELPVGKKGAMKTCAVLQDLVDIDVYMQVQMEYSAWNNNIQEKKIIRGFYRDTDKATAEEIVNDADKGKTYEKNLEEYATKVVYKDGLDEDAIKNWIKSNRPKGTATYAGSSEAPSFGERKGFGSKKAS